MADGDAGTFSAVTGASAAVALEYLEAAGGDLEVAIGRYFEEGPANSAVGDAAGLQPAADAPFAAADKVRQAAAAAAAEAATGGELSIAEREAWQEYLREELQKPRMSILKILDPTSPGSFLPMDVLQDRAGDDDRAQISLLLATVPKSPPQGLQDFQYAFDAAKALRNVESGGPFQFVGERHYECLGDFVVAEVQKEMEERLGMVRYAMSESCAEEGSLDVFVSREVLEGGAPPRSLLVIVQGSGRVRPGVWARGPCVNESLHIGSMLPTIQRAHHAGMAVLVCNPNQRCAELAATAACKRAGLGWEYFISPEPPVEYDAGSDVVASESAESHVVDVWDRLVAPWLSAQPAGQVAIIAHSAGGMAVMTLVRERGEALRQVLRCVAFTDAAHDVTEERYGAEWSEFFKASSRDWVSSPDPLDQHIAFTAFDDVVPRVSAGTPQHERTSGCSEQSVWHFIAHCVDGIGSTHGA